MLELEHFLPYRLNVLAEKLSTALARRYSRQAGIGIPEWRVLATLGQYVRMSSKDIGAHSRMHKTKVSRAVALLLDKGLVAKASNSEDLREAFLSLTPEGQQVYEGLVPLALDFEKKLLAHLAPEDQSRLHDVLRRLDEAALEEAPDDRAL